MYQNQKKREVQKLEQVFLSYFIRNLDHNLEPHRRQNCLNLVMNTEQTTLVEWFT